MKFWPPNEAKLVREGALEQVRRDSFAQLPSRQACNYVFDDLAVARESTAAFGPHFLLYEVKLVEPQAPIHRAAFNLLSGVKSGTFKELNDYWVRVAEDYWSGNSIEVPEILTASPIEIVSVLP